MGFFSAGTFLFILAYFMNAQAFPDSGQAGSANGKIPAAEGASILNPTKLPPFEIPFLDKSPVIDGILDDVAWQRAPLALGDWLTYNPAYGQTMAQKTEIWIAHDSTFLYFAFRCLDPEPNRIKTSVARRDTIWNDDWVGVSLDALGSGQSSYDLFVNPSGIQGDILNSSTAGEDTAPDWVWDSAGKTGGEGYTAEMRIPFKSIRFRSGAEVRMGVIFWRRVSRLGVSASWPDLPRGTSIFTRYAPIRLHNVKRPLTLEAIPNFTYSFRQSRRADGQWDKADSRPDAGITAKYGITSTVTLEGTVRPDFSQVESDSFQVEVNQRYPIFYSEKRPFFMEGMGTFQLAGAGGDGNMRTAVHTRRIIDPLYGFKLSGNLGRLTFAALSASDRAPGKLEDADPLNGKRKSFNLARSIYSLGKGSYAGGFFADTEFGGGFNRVAGGDISLQMGDRQQWSATMIGSDSRPVSGGSAQNGFAGQMQYSYTSKRYEAGIQMEHYGRNFQMDTAFYNRVGITGGWAYSAINFYPDEKRYGWFKRINPFVFFRGYQDRVQGGNDRIIVAGLRLYFTRQGQFRVHIVEGKEPWGGRLFNIRETLVQGQTQLLRWLNVQSSFSMSRSIYYDPENPFPGNDRYLSVNLTIQPSSKLSQSVGFTRDAFDRLDGQRVYTVNILNTRTSYQINRRFAVRAIVRYNSLNARVLTDFLGSYELVPGTVAYAGYGALYEREAWNGQEYVRGSGDYLNTQRGLFFKVSYLHRF